MAAEAVSEQLAAPSALSQAPFREPSVQDAEEQAKIQSITEACSTKDIDRLVSLATSDGGFVNDDLRQRAWPVLLGLDLAIQEKEQPWRTLPEHHDEAQVLLDVNRSFVNYPKNESEKQIDARKVSLQDIIVEVLRRHPSLCYFQGYHDIVQVFLLVLGPTKSVPLVRRLSMLRIRDFLLPKLSASVSHLQLLPAILYRADRQLYDILPSNPFYGLSHVLTLYAHDIQSYNDIARLFDFLLAREAVMTIYLFAVIIISRREELLEHMADDPDPNIMSAILSRLPENINLQEVIESAIVLFKQHPPQQLPFRSWKRISNDSVLKTTMDPQTIPFQTLEQGQSWFDQQADEIQREEARKQMLKDLKHALYKHRRPAIFVVSIFVALFAIRSGKGGAICEQIYRAWNASGLRKFLALDPRYREL